MTDKKRAVMYNRKLGYRKATRAGELVLAVNSSKCQVDTVRNGSGGTKVASYHSGGIMALKSGRNFLFPAAALALFAGLAGSAFANHHHEFNGTWQLVAARSELNGEPAIESGTVTINDREGNIYVDRNFSLEDGNRTVTTNVATDARAKATIKEPGFRSKAKWYGDMLQVTTLHDGVTTVERYSLLPDGDACGSLRPAIGNTVLPTLVAPLAYARAR
jgi:hypothetical protein